MRLAAFSAASHPELLHKCRESALSMQGPTRGDLSGVFCPETGRHACRNVRTSQGTFIARREDKEGVLAWMEDKLASLTGIPATHGEVRIACCVSGICRMHSPV